MGSHVSDACNAGGAGGVSAGWSSAGGSSAGESIGDAVRQVTCRVKRLRYYMSRVNVEGPRCWECVG